MADEFFKWDDSTFGLSVPEMDDEHKTLINKMNLLYKTVDQKGSATEVGKCIDDLAQYTIKHFADEEAYMEKIGYDGIKTHKIIHQQLLDQFQGHVEEFKKTSQISPKFFDFLKVWLTSHIRGIDKKYADFKPIQGSKAS